MNLFKQFCVSLPSSIQGRILERMIKTGRVFQVPVYRMLLHSLQFLLAIWKS
jgi:hypothetical protein